MNGHSIAVFDFDGTITRHDSFVQFILFCKGRWRFWAGFLFLSPVIALWKLHVLKNYQAKQMVFSFFFKKMDLAHFDKLCEQFCQSYLSADIQDVAKEKIAMHREKGDRLVIVSASAGNWIRPLAKALQFDTVISTEIEVEDGKLTGHFATQNCFGQEKIARLCAELGITPENRPQFQITAYGDSKGDREMLRFADVGFFRYQIFQPRKKRPN